jgi:hypothetical protein
LIFRARRCSPRQAVHPGLLLALATGCAMEASDHYRLAAVHRQNADVALAHALADGGASLDGYPDVPPDVVRFAGGSNPLPTFTPVPSERAETAVAADTAFASYAAAQATEAKTDGRLILGGAGAVALTGFGLLYPLASIGAEWAALRVCQSAAQLGFDKGFGGEHSA